MTTMDEQYQRGYDAARDELSVDQEYIDELHEENEKLKEQINGDNFWGINKGLKQEKSDLIKQYQRVFKENLKLKKQNDNIKKFLNELWDAFCVEHSDKKE